MLDPGAIGTLVVGLGAVLEQENERRRPAAAQPRRRRAGVRVAIARGLRRAASMLDQPTVREITNA